MRARLAPIALLAAVHVVVATGCATKSPPTADELQKQALPHTKIPEAWKAGGGAAAPVADRWLASFNDPALTALVEEALGYNYDLQVAATRVEQAGGYVKVASAALLPTLGLAGVGGGKSGGSGGLDGVWLNAALELDVWGRLRYARNAAEEQSVSANADYMYARQSLAATVAKSWFLAIEAGLQRTIAQEALRSSDSLLHIAQERFRVGSGNEQTVAEARAYTGNYRDRLRQIELGREQALRSLEILLGRYPAAEIAVADRLTPLPPPAPVGVPSQLLERRPDVIAAERRVAAAFNRVGEARAAQLPRLSLTAGGSYVSSDLIVLQETGPLWSVGGSLLAPLYRGGELRAQVEIRTAEQKQAVAEYARAGQRAFGEVENALGAETALSERSKILEATVRDSERALELVQVQYRVGSVDLRSVEQSQIALYSARIALLRVQTEILAQRVNLHLALGGGFDLPPLEPLAAQ